MSPPVPWQYIAYDPSRLIENGNDWESTQQADPRTGEVLLPKRCTTLEDARAAIRVAEAQFINNQRQYRIYCAATGKDYDDAATQRASARENIPLCPVMTILAGYAAAHPTQRWTAWVPRGHHSKNGDGFQQVIEMPAPPQFQRAGSPFEAASALIATAVAPPAPTFMGFVRDGARIDVVNGTGLSATYADADTATDVATYLQTLSQRPVITDSPLHCIAPATSPAWDSSSLQIVSEVRARVLAARGPLYRPRDPAADLLSGVEYAVSGRELYSYLPEKREANRLADGSQFPSVRFLFMRADEAKNALSLLRKKPPARLPMGGPAAAPAAAAVPASRGYVLGGR